MEINKNILTLTVFLLIFGVLFTSYANAALDISIDRVKVNGNVVSDSGTNIIEDADTFLLNVDFTAVIALEKGHVEAMLKGKQTGLVVSDSTMTFDLSKSQSATVALTLNLIDNLKRETDFELKVKVIDARGNFEQKIYQIQTKRAVSAIGKARQLDISIDSVEIDNDVIAEDENNFIVLKEGRDELDLRVRLTSLETIKNARVEAILTFDNGDVVADATTTFDIAKDGSAIKRLELPLISKFGQSSFKLKVRVIDAEGDSEEKVYGLKISQKKFPFIISSIKLNPESNVQAGRALGVALSFKNSGVMPLEGMNAKVSIPELGISSTRFIDQIKSNQDDIKEDFILKIPDTVQTGTYTVSSEIFSQFDGEKEVKEISLYIIGKEQISQISQVSGIEINVPLVTQTIDKDNKEVIYPIILTNKAQNAKSYTVLVEGLDLAELSYKISPTNTFIIEPAQTKTVNIAVSANNAQGQRIFTVIIKSGSEAFKEIPLKVVIIKSAYNIRKIFEWFILLTVLLFTAAAIYYTIKIYTEKEGGKKEEIVKEPIPTNETYY